MSGFDESSEFEQLLAELEQAAEDLTGSNRTGSSPLDPEDFGADELDPLFEEESDELWGRAPTRLNEEPESLVDLRALSLDQPLSHELNFGAEPHDGEALGEVEPGVVVDHKYEIVGSAPRNTVGWEAQHVVLRQKFIVQFLDPEIVENPILWPKFQSDIRAAGMLGHENIEFVTDFGQCPRYGAYLVKQWIDGPTFETFLQDHGTRPLSDAVDFAHAVGEALAALHDVGIIHGRLSPTNVRYATGPDGRVWKLLDVCIPGGGEELLAPEQRRGEATGPEADQYALALLTWRMMLGPDADPDTSPGELPEEVIAVLRRAMDEMSLNRWPDVDTFVGELMRVAPSDYEPTIHPFDRREASRLVEEAVAEPEEADEPSIDFDDQPRSMRIDVDPDALQPHVLAMFNTGARLRREYRRNMLAGGLFVPTSGHLPVGGSVRVELRFPARDASVTVPADVVSFDPGGDERPRGYGVAFGAKARKEIESFVASLNLGLGISPTHRIEMVRELDRDAPLDPGAAFLASRLSGSTTVGAARAMFAGLPYDFDQCLSALIDAGYVSVGPEKEEPRPDSPRREVTREPEKDTERESQRQTRPKPRHTPRTPISETGRQPVERSPSKRTSSDAPGPGSFESHEWSDVDRVMETVDFFEEQGNFMAAGRLLESAAENAPDVAAYHHRLGLLRARFDMNLADARQAIAKARRLEPDNDDFAAAERYIATLVEISAVRTAWEAEFSGDVRWIRTEPALGLAWFEIRRPGAIELLEVNWRSGEFDVAARDDEWAVVPENDIEFDALERRKPAKRTSERERRRRQLEIARRFGGIGPHFENRPVATTRTMNSTLEAWSAGGIVVQRHDGEPIRLADSEAYDPKFASDEQVLAWVEPHDDRWALVVSPVTGPPNRRATYDARPTFRWLDDSSGLVVLEPKSGRVEVLDRRSGSQEIVTLSGFVRLSLIPGVEPEDALVVGRRVVGRQAWLATRLNLRRAEAVEQYELPAGGTKGLLRGDGKLALVLEDQRLLVADLPGSRVKRLSTVSPVPASVVGANWEENSPLHVVEIVDGTTRVLSLDVDLLCG